MANYSDIKYQPAGSATTTYSDMAALIAATGMSAGDQALVTALNKVFMYTGSAWYLVATMTNDSPTAITGVNGTYQLATDGTATTVTAVSSDPEGFPLTWSYAVTTGSLGSTATVSQADNVFTITPSTTEADAGSFSITFSVTDGATGAVSAVGAFTLSFSVTNSRYTSLSVNAPVTSPGRLYTLSDTHSPSGQHMTLGFVTMPSNQIFTIEGWFRIDSTSAAEIWFFDQHTAGVTGRSVLGVRAGNITAFGTGGWSNGSSAFSDTTTYKHLAWVQNGSDTLNFYINGVASGTHTAFGQTAQQNTMFGENTAYGGAGFSCKGFRVTNTAVYTSGFTPPNIIGGLTDISGTQVLWDGSVGTATDASSNSRSLTNNGMTFTFSGGSNQTFDDASSTNHTITVAGDTTASTFSPHRHGGYSTYLGTQTSRYYSPSSSDFDIGGTGDWSYEAWVYADNQTFPGYTRGFGLGPYYNNTKSFGIELSDAGASNNITVYWDDDGGLSRKLTSSTAFSQEVWHHLLVCRSGNDIALFLDGTRIAHNNSYTSSIDSGNTYLFVGHTGFGTEGFMGHIRDVRFINGSHPYDASASSITVPTEPLTATTNTKFLLGDLSYFKDQSASNHAITFDGDVSLKPKSVFDNSPYSEASHGASAYFDGTGDSLTIPHHADFDFSGDYVLEFWFNLIDTGAAQLLFDKSTGSETFQIYTLSSGNQLADMITDSSGNIIENYANTGPVVVGTGWHHFSLVRDNSAGTYVTYLDGVVHNTTSSASNNTSTADVTIGCMPNGTAPSKGYISDVKFLTTIPSDRNAAFTPPTSPSTPDSNTKFLLNPETSISDLSQKSEIKCVGDAATSTTQVKFAGTKSIAFDGTGDYLVPSSTAMNIPSSTEFTIEGWVYFTGIGSYEMLFGGTGTQYMGLRSNNNNFEIVGGSSNTFFPWTANNNIWYYITVVRNSSNIIKLWIDGVEVTPNSGATNTSAFALANIGRAGGYTSHDFQGYMQDVRITKGLARYTANFTPPTEELEG